MRHTIICGIANDYSCNMEKISELSGEEEDSNMLNRSEKYATMAEVMPTAQNS